MKPLTILFENNVFKVLPEYPNDFKCNAVTIDNFRLLPISYVPNPGYYLFNAPKYPILTPIKLKSGDILQVEGFEYERVCHYKVTTGNQCKTCGNGCQTEVAILKLAKEEEPKETKLGVAFEITEHGNLFMDIKTLDKTIHLKLLPDNRAFFAIYRGDQCLDNGIGPLNEIIKTIGNQCSFEIEKLKK